MVTSFSVVIAGPILSRMPESAVIRAINSYKNIPGCSEIILSTYNDETNSEIEKLCTHVVENIDPGPDFFSQGENPLKSNLTRLLRTTVSGLMKSSSEITIKTRIEFFVHDEILLRRQIEKLEEKKIVCIEQHCYPTGFRMKNPLFWFPDTFQIGKTEKLKYLWAESALFWEIYKARGRIQGINLFSPVQIANEQILGIGLATQEIKDKLLKYKLHRFFAKLKFVTVSIFMQLENISPVKLENLGISSTESRLVIEQPSRQWVLNFQKIQRSFQMPTNSKYFLVKKLQLKFYVCNTIMRVQKMVYFLSVYLKHRRYP